MPTKVAAMASASSSKRQLTFGKIKLYAENTSKKLTRLGRCKSEIKKKTGMEARSNTATLFIECLALR